MRAKELERRVHSQCIFHDKLHTLDLTFDPRLPDRFQIALDSHYGVLHNPYVACEAAEAFLGYGTTEARVYVQTVSLQAAILHPGRLDIGKVFVDIFERDYVLAHPKPYAYAIARLFAWAISGKKPKTDGEFEELLLLYSCVRPMDLQVYYALCERDYDKLELVRPAILGDSDSKYYAAWWNRFFELYLEIKVLDEDILPSEPSSDFISKPSRDEFSV